MKENTPIRVLIAEDEALLARALADSLQRLAGATHIASHQHARHG